MTDPIADMLSRIRNGIAVNKTSVIVPFSKLKERVANELVNAGFLESIEVVESPAGFKDIKVTIRPIDGISKINTIERVSKPGRRMYAAAAELKPVLGGRGVMIISTSQGVMTDFEARKRKIGGELICKVY